MLEYRSFYYYFLLSFFTVSLLFIRTINPSVKSVDLQKSKIVDKKNKTSKVPSNYQLIEVMNASDFPDLTREYFIAENPSKGLNQGQSKSNSLLRKKRLQLKQNEMSKMSVPKDLGSGSANFRSSLKNDETETKKISIDLDTQGNLSINAAQFKGAEYLINEAKNIFNYWIDFLPMQMIYEGFLRNDWPGVLEGFIRFQKQPNQKYSVKLIKPFDSQVLNSNINNSFQYYHITPTNQVDLIAIQVHFIIYKETMRVSANFQFEIRKKNH